MTIRGSRRPHVVPITAPSFPTPPRTSLYRNIAYSFIACTVVLVLTVLWLSSVRAEVTVHTKRTTVKLDTTVEVARAPQSGQIPGRVVQGVFEKIQEFPVPMMASTSTAVVPTPASLEAVKTPSPTPVLARGTARIINNYSRSQTLVRTTRLLTSDQKLYRIDQTIKIPPGQEVSVRIYADQLGAEYAIGPTRFTIPGLFIDLQKYIYAVSDAAFVATPSETPVAPSVPAVAISSSPSRGDIVTQADLDVAIQSLSDTVLAQAKRTLMAEVADANLGEAVYVVKRLDKKTNVAVGQSADHFLASVKLDVTAVFYPKEDMAAFTRLKLKEKIPEGREFVATSDGQGTVYTPESADAKAETAVIHIIADGAYRLTSASAGLQKSVIAGKSTSEATAILKSLEGVEDAQVKIKPSWFSKVPSLKDKITMTLE